MSSARPTQEELAETREKVLSIMTLHLSREEKLRRLDDALTKEEMARLIRHQESEMMELWRDLDIVSHAYERARSAAQAVARCSKELGEVLERHRRNT
jgi:hypothetical protein